MSSDIALKIEKLSKCYQIYDSPRDRLKQFILPRLYKLFGITPRQYHREFWALRDVSFEVRKGETVGIIGRNGSGKSTLLQLVCGTLTPTSGAISVSGRVAALLELGSGFNPEFTGRENVYLNATLLGLTSEEVTSRFNDIVKFADIGQFIDQPVKTYSSGMMVRLAFAVIAHVDADILIIDEALAVGDAFFVQKCMRFLRTFMEHGTILFVSHDTSAVVNLCQSALWLQQGTLNFQGSPKRASELYLAALYESEQGPSVIASNNEEPSALSEEVQPVNEQPALSDRDMRLDFLNNTNNRNDIEIFSFSSKSISEHFGKGGATITNVKLLDDKNIPLSWVVGGELVTLSIECQANKDIVSPIIGFHLKDRLGQELFADNTYISYRDNPQKISKGQRFEAKFVFRMPILPKGDYSVTTAVAEGTQQAHIQHQWIHEALIVKSHSSSVCTGLVGIPMHRITISTL